MYNILPDIISRLSDPETGIEEAPFKSIMRYNLLLVHGKEYAEKYMFFKYYL